MHDHADLMSYIYFRDWAVLCTLPHYIIGKYEPPARENILRGLPPGLALLHQETQQLVKVSCLQIATLKQQLLRGVLINISYDNVIFI